MYVHIVWGTWDRLPLITNDIQMAVYRSLGAQCQSLQVEVIALGGMEDHLHMLVQLPTTLALADLVKQVKGATTHLVTHVLAPNSFFKWQGAFGAVSVSPDDLPRISNYIAHQREHHTNQSLVPTWELPTSATQSA